jgi:hypothetical protein
LNQATPLESGTRSSVAQGRARRLNDADRFDVRANPVFGGAIHAQLPYKSMRITTRRRVGRLTSVKPAAVNTPSVPTWSSSEITSLVVIG